MKKNWLRKTVVTGAVLASVLLLGACGNSDNGGGDTGTAAQSESNEPLKIWTTSNALKESAENWGDETDKKVEVVVIPYSDFQTKLKQGINDATTAPDVFIVSRDFVKEWSNRENAIVNLEKEFSEDVKKYKSDAFEDIVKFGSNDKDQLVAMTGEYPVGMMFYNRSIAKDVLGTDDPEDVVVAMDTVEKWQGINAKIKEKYAGKTKLFGTWEDTNNMLVQQRTKPWVKDETFTIDETFADLFDQTEKMYQESMFVSEGENEAYQAGYNQNIFFAQFLPSWGFSSKIRPQIQGKESAGNWGVTTPTYSYARGGSYFFIAQNSANKKNAWEYVKSQTVDTDYLVADQKSKVGYPSSKKAAEELVASGFSEPLLGDQKVYEMYQKQADVQSAETKDVVTKYDGTILGFVNDLLKSYGAGNISKEDALKELGNKVKTAFPELKIVEKY